MYLSLKDSNVFKGLAILLMLWHHLFYNCQQLYDEFGFLTYDVIEYTRVMAKLCVSIFVFISGYGLAVKAEKQGGIGSLKSFYRHRFTKLYLNYWYIWLLFVPISVFIFHRTLEMAYRENILQSLVLDILGVINCTGGTSYNPTWWFYSCIIILYAIFPFVYYISKKDLLFTVLFCVCVKYLPYEFNPIKNYIYVFLAGIVYVRYSPFTNFFPPTREKAAWLVLLALMLMERNSVGQVTDCVITCCLVKLYAILGINSKIKSTMAYLGKHSMNIFLIHTFIFNFWFMHQVYSSRNPIVIFIVLLLSCLVISVALEWLKDVIGFNKLIKKMSKYE